MDKYHSKLNEIILVSLFISSMVNFAGALQGFGSMWRCLTGEDWYQLMWDVAVSTECHMTIM